ncbi:MAG: RDD family protein [Rhodothermales bacterium]
MTALRRILAYLADMVIVYVYMILLYFASTALNDIWPFHAAMGESYALRHLVGFFTLTLPMIAYFSLFEAGRRQATPGKRLLKISVQSPTGEMTLRRALLRNGVKFLPWEIAHTHLHLNPAFMFTGETTYVGWALGVWLPVLAAFVYLGMMFFAPAGRTPYDLAARTHVGSVKG